MLDRVPGPALSSEQAQALATRIRLLGAARGLTSDRGLAESAGLSPKAISDIEGSTKGPSLSTLIALSEALGLYSIDELLGFSATRFFGRRDDVRSLLGPMIDRLEDTMEA